MSTEPKFKPGDLVWAKLLTGGEAATVVVKQNGICSQGHPIYFIENDTLEGDCCEPWLRPRRLPSPSCCRRIGQSAG